jgi:hypothetical protein
MHFQYLFPFSNCLLSHTLQQMLKTSSIRIIARMDISNLGLSRLFEGPGAVAIGTTGIKNALTKCFFFSIKTEYTRVFKCPHM